MQLIHDSEKHSEQNFVENNTPSNLRPIGIFASVTVNVLLYCRDHVGGDCVAGTGGHVARLSLP